MNPNRGGVKFVWLSLSGKGTNSLRSLEGFHRLPVCGMLALEVPCTPPPSLSPSQGHLCLWSRAKGFPLRTSFCLSQALNSCLFKLISQPPPPGSLVFNDYSVPVDNPPVPINLHTGHLASCEDAHNSRLWHALPGLVIYNIAILPRT